MKQKVYVVVESSWNGSCYSADDASVFTTLEEAKKYETWLKERFKADTDTFVVEKEVETRFDPNA